MKGNIKLYSVMAVGLVVVVVVGLFAIGGPDYINEQLKPFVDKTRPWMGFPDGEPNAEHGHAIDAMIIYVHVLMLVLFVGWSSYYIYALIRFRKSRHPDADYHGFRDKGTTTLVEYGVIFVEIILIALFAVPLWARMVDANKFPSEGVKSVKEFDTSKNPKSFTPAKDGLYMLHLDSDLKSKVTISDSKGDTNATLNNEEVLAKMSNEEKLNEGEKQRITMMLALEGGTEYTIKTTGDGTIKVGISEMPTVVIRVIAEQFKWNGYYSGFDGVFGRQEMRLATVQNPFGKVENDPHGLDDFIVEKVIVPEGVDVITHISSKDVIHCFKVIPLRICQDAIPGLQIPVHFKARKKMKTWINCAQLCGDGHAAMRGDFEVMSQKDFATWWNQNSGWWLKAPAPKLAVAP